MSSGAWACDRIFSLVAHRVPWSEGNLLVFSTERHLLVLILCTDRAEVRALVTLTLWAYLISGSLQQDPYTPLAYHEILSHHEASAQPEKQPSEGKAHLQNGQCFHPHASDRGLIPLHCEDLKKTDPPVKRPTPSLGPAVDRPIMEEIQGGCHQEIRS